MLYAMATDKAARVTLELTGPDAGKSGLWDTTLTTGGKPRVYIVSQGSFDDARMAFEAADKTLRLVDDISVAAPIAPADTLIKRMSSFAGDEYRLYRLSSGEVVAHCTSGRSGNEYVIRRNADNKVSCTCPSQTAGNRDYCRHVDFLRSRVPAFA